MDPSNKYRIPGRSRLFGLEPVGFGTPLVESLTSYLGRLAKAHCIPLKILFMREIVPLLSSSYLTTTGKLAAYTFYETIGYQNGICPKTLDLVEIVEKLTGRKDIRFLTLIQWAPLLPSNGLVKPSKAYCPYCFEEWRSNGETIYEPLIWALLPVKVCPVHKTELATVCPHCTKALPLIGKFSYPGYCEACKKWLGETPDKPKNQNCEQDDWFNWVNNSLGQMLALSPSINNLPTKDMLLESLMKFKDGISIRNLAIRMGLPHTTVWENLKGRYMPTLNFLLRYCFINSMSFPEFLASGEIIIEPNNHTDRIVSEIYPKTKNKKGFDNEVVKSQLEDILSKYDQEPITLRETATRIGYCENTLRNHFPVLCHLISTRHKEYLNRNKLIRRDKLVSDVVNITRILHAEGIYPSKKRLGKILKPGVLREKSIKDAWYSVMRELGLK